MNPQDKIDYLTSEVEKIKSDIESKLYQIELLHSSIRIEKKRLKTTEQAIEEYKKQVK